MGWMPPPLFTATTKTVADLANQELQALAPIGTHHFDVVSTSQCAVSEFAPSLPSALPTAPFPTKTSPHGRPRPPVKTWDVYVGIFIGMVQGNLPHRRRVKRIMINILAKIFRPLDQQYSKHHQEPASFKKIQKGDAMWATRKLILG
jgi:hypothetical protein